MGMGDQIKMSSGDFAQRIIASRRDLIPEGGFSLPRGEEAEGGCGVIGMASNVQIAAKHMLQSLMQMRNRGNGKGGGIAAVGLIPEEFGVTKEVLENDYLIAVAYLDIDIRQELEVEFIHKIFDVDHTRLEKHLQDYKSLEGLEVRPPEVVEYFVRVKHDQVEQYRQKFGMLDAPQRVIEDEIVFQNSFHLNIAYYKSTGDKRAFVLSHGKNMLVLKMVGYGDDVIRYYQLEEMRAHIWIGHHRYPTKGRVWHPGGAHPFIGLNEALVHNGDFANHASISEYLAQRNIYPLFLTDTEVAVQVFDLLHRTYGYPMEYVIEAMAPTTERDFSLLPEEKQRVYKMLQQSHMHCSPDGPWFFLIAQSNIDKENKPVYRLTGITDTSMLRPQVFAWQENHQQNSQKVAVGFAASEKQGIDAALESLAETDLRFWSRADKYWNARGGSHVDGGAFLYSVSQNGNGLEITCTDKFGRLVSMPTSTPAFMSNGKPVSPSNLDIPQLPTEQLFDWFKDQVIDWDYPQLNAFLQGMDAITRQEKNWRKYLDLLTLMMDRRYDTGKLRRSSLLSITDQALSQFVNGIDHYQNGDLVLHQAGMTIPEPSGDDHTVLLDALAYTPQDETSVAREIQRMFEKGFKRFVIVNTKGHRFIANGLGPNTSGVRIDVYGSPGDYLASGLDGLEIQVHNNGQDQLAQIMKSGKLVVHGDVGQTFLYAAKGGEVYVMGNTAGRPLINAVGKPRVVINGTCLDYLAESFMAGDPLKGGGFVVLNGITFDEHNQLVELDTPYPGGNLFSLASGGAIYVRDPRRILSEEQLNGGEFRPFNQQDWKLIEPYLAENARLFDIPLRRLLSVDGDERSPAEVYRKIRPRAMRALQAEEAWVTEGEE
jgi:glutamate synthase domain-containing protein 1/glutamate synthase domain-containing protein 3